MSNTKLFFRVVVVGAFLCCSAAAQAPSPTADRLKLLATAREIMQSSRFCALITVDETGRAQARTVQPYAPDENMVVWIATNTKTRKVAQIKRDPRVALYYFNPAAPGLGYVTLLGRARLVMDEAEIQKRWKPEMQKLWPDRARFLLVEVTPERLEVVSPQNGINGDPVTWMPPATEFKQGATPK